MSISPQSRPPKRRLATTFAVGGAAVLTGLVVAFGTSVAQGSADSGASSGSGPTISVPKPPTITTGKVSGTASERSA